MSHVRHTDRNTGDKMIIYEMRHFILVGVFTNLCFVQRKPRELSHFHIVSHFLRIQPSIKGVLKGTCLRKMSH